MYKPPSQETIDWVTAELETLENWTTIEHLEDWTVKIHEYANNPYWVSIEQLAGDAEKNIHEYARRKALNEEIEKARLENERLQAPILPNRSQRRKHAKLKNKKMTKSRKRDKAKIDNYIHQKRMEAAQRATKQVYEV